MTWLSRIAPALPVLTLIACADPLRPGMTERPPSPAAQGAIVPAASVVAPLYALDFVATAASGIDMNDAGDIVGTAYTDPGCGPFCLPPQEHVVWRNGTRTVVPPLVAGNAFVTSDISNAGWMAGYSVAPNGATTAALWRPSGGAYSVTDLGILTGRPLSEATRLDETGRVIGYSRMTGFPAVGSPFVWSESGGYADLALAGYPNEPPIAVSRGGTVATSTYWYRLGDPTSVRVQPAAPIGYLLSAFPIAINDNGDIARFLVSTSSQNLVYPHRLANGGTWQLLGPGTGSLSSYGMGSINDALDVTFTALGGAFVAPGPSSTGTPLASRISQAYPGTGITVAGAMNASGQILAKALVGRSARLVRLTPAAPCAANCLRSSAIALTGTFVQDRRNPGQCIQSPKVYNALTANVTITSETGAPLRNAVVTAHFMDDYWTDKTVTATTNTKGIATLKATTPACVGTVAVLVTQVTLGTRTLDRTTGVLTASVIPR